VQSTSQSETFCLRVAAHRDLKGVTLMARVPKPRAGRRVSIKGKPLRFSFWPMYKGARRYGLHSRLYVTNPWALIEGSIKRRCPATSQAEAVFSARQAEQFFKASREAQLWASKPLLTYYSFLNLAKAYALTQGQQPTYEKAQHGLSERIKPGGQELLPSALE
jgi:YaaC-like Protein